jgi:hypothetical protein
VWRRTVCLALGVWVVSVIADPMIQKVEPQWVGHYFRIELPRVASCGDKPTIVRHMFRSVGEHIEVPRPAPQIYEFSPHLGVDDVLRRDGGSWHPWRLSGGRFVLRRQEARADLTGIVPETEVWREDRIPDLAIDVKSKPSSGGAPAVSPYWSDAPMVFSAYDLPYRTKLDRKDESPFIGNHGLPSQASLFACSGRQNYREHRNHGSCQPSNGGIILIKESAGATDGNGPSLDDRHNDIGRSFYLRLGTVIRGLFAYACLKRR